MPKQKFSPLPAAAFHILMALVDDDLHGYEIMRRVEEQTAGRTRLGPGTLYSSIQALLEAGFIVEVSQPGAADTNDERRRYYRVTAAGRRAGREEAERMADLLRIARAKKILRGGVCLTASSPSCCGSIPKSFDVSTDVTRCN